MDIVNYEVNYIIIQNRQLEQQPIDNEKSATQDI